MLDAEEIDKRTAAWLDSVRARVAGAGLPSSGVTAPLLQADRDRVLLAAARPMFDAGAVLLAGQLAQGTCDLSQMPIPYKYFRHWRIANPVGELADDTAGALFLLGNAALHYLRSLASLDTSEFALLRSIAHHVRRAAVDDVWQWIVRVPVRNLGGRIHAHQGFELRPTTSTEDAVEVVRSGARMNDPSWSFVFEGDAARPPLHLRTVSYYFTVRTIGPYPGRLEEGAGDLDEVHVTDVAVARLMTWLLGFQLLGFEPESDGHVSQQAYPRWLLNSTRVRQASLPPSRAGFSGWHVDGTTLRSAQHVVEAIGDIVFMGSQQPVHVALRRFHHAVKLGVTRAGFLEHTAALECLLIPRDSRTRLSKQFRENGAALLGASGVERVADEQELKDLYALRSDIVHGSSVPRADQLSTATRRVRLLAARMLCNELRVPRDGCSPRENDVRVLRFTT